MTIDARDAGSGTSASDRARTIAVAVADDSSPDDLVKGGHVLPLIARAGGVLERRGHTEASVDLARLAGLAPAGVLCEVLNADGSMARISDLVAFCAQHRLRMFSIAHLVEYRTHHALDVAGRE